MRLIGKEKIRPLLDNNIETKTWILALADEIKSTVWISEGDLKEFYPCVYKDAAGLFTFQIEQGSCVVKIKFCFSSKIAFISQVLVGKQ